MCEYFTQGESALLPYGSFECDYQPQAEEMHLSKNGKDPLKALLLPVEGSAWLDSHSEVSAWEQVFKKLASTGEFARENKQNFVRHPAVICRIGTSKVDAKDMDSETVLPSQVLTVD